MATGTGYIYKTLPNDLRIKVKTQVFGRIIGDTNTSLRLLGDTTNVTMGRTIEESEVYSNETPDKDLALTDVTKNDIQFTLELRQMTEFAKRILFQSDAIKTNQAAATDQKIIFQDQTVGDLLPLGAMNVTDVIVKIGTDVLVRGTHYSLDEEAGRIQIDALPGNATEADIDVTFDAPATTITSYGLASRTDIRVELFMRQNNKWGPSFEYSVWNCQARPDGDLQIGQDGDDFGSATIICRAYADSTRPAAFRLGQVRQIPKKLAA